MGDDSGHQMFVAVHRCVEWTRNGHVDVLSHIHMNNQAEPCYPNRIG